MYSKRPNIQCLAKQMAQAPRYEVNLGVIGIAFHRLKMQLRSWSLLSKKIKTGGFQKCKVHCCNFKDYKVTSLQSLATPGFEPGPPSWVTNGSRLTHTGGVGLNPRVAKLWRFVTLKSLKLQQCTLHFGNLQSLSFGTREIRSVVIFSDYDMLSPIPLGLLHNKGLVQSQMNRTVRN